jgi:hypothetical protein
MKVCKEFVKGFKISTGKYGGGNIEEERGGKGSRGR